MTTKVHHNVDSTPNISFPKLNKPFLVVAALVAALAALLIGGAAAAYFTHLLGWVPSSIIGGSGVALGFLDFTVIALYFGHYLWKKHTTDKLEILTYRFED